MDIKDLESKTIHDVRNLARELGVRSPSTLNKDEVIKRINQINNGEREPYFSSKGRKPRSKLIVNKITKKELSEFEVNKINELIDKLKTDIIELLK